MHRVELLDQRTRRVRVEAGARWAQVAETLSRYGLAISSGGHGNVGVGWLVTAGGVGWLVRRYGLTIDHVQAVDVVLADGTLVHADAAHEPDLFWAVRGAGAGVGIVVAFEIEALELSSVGYAQIVVETDRQGRTLTRWAELMAEAPRDLSSAVMLVPYGNGLAMSITAVVAAESARRVRPAVAPLPTIGVKLLDQRAQLVPYPALVSTAHLHPNIGQQPSITTNGLLTMTDDNARAIMGVATDRRQPLNQMRSMGGAVNDRDGAADLIVDRRGRSG
ncbi:FAD-dependent oxidoreductase [Plantactinospora sp. ZYX-F-223]|uniref:FAD-binding oxidoreductase n=1 Tax=Plantactinospora sp. ZYX-F-223 TaxID=3144103 RepID=UPI0031FCD176